MATRLKKKVQLFIVELLACYEKPSDVAKVVKDELQVEVSRQQVEYYDPTKALSAAGLSQELRDHFWAKRKEYNDTSATHVGGLNYRLGILHFMIMRALGRDNYPLVAQLLEQVAKDKGGSFTSKRQIEIENPIGMLASMLGLKPEDLPPPDVLAKGEKA